MNKDFSTPIVFIIFNRPGLTEEVFEKIREIKPSIFFVIADGPRKKNKNDQVLCKKTREIIEKVDWPCKLLKNYSDNNLGCGPRISSGLDWVFNQVEEAIILEDDCLPSNDFFFFCSDLLDYYKNNEKILNISGFSPPVDEIDIYPYSYYFSYFVGTWGWATWANKWKKINIEIKEWKNFKKTDWLNSKLENRSMLCYFRDCFNDVEKEIISAWDIQFNFLLLKENLFTAKSSKNLVRNIGFNQKDATHTVFNSKLGGVSIETTQFPLSHPQSIEWNKKIDLAVLKSYYESSKYFSILKRILKKNTFLYTKIKKLIIFFKKI